MKSTIQAFRTRLREAFFKALEAKTGWGRLEIQKEFILAETRTLAEMLDEEITNCSLRSAR